MSVSKDEQQEPVRVGGQALPDGVFMRTERAWAVARADGTLTTGPMPSPRTPHVPVLRVLLNLIPALRLGLARGVFTRQARARRADRRRFVAALVGCEVAAAG